MGVPQLKPEKFGRYVLLDRIGTGGMAEVFRAVMPGAQGFKQTLVVKRIIAERAHTSDFVDIGIVSGAHGSHVAGITAANDMFGGQMDGAAPGAQLVTVPGGHLVLHEDTDRGAALIERYALGTGR